MFSEPPAIETCFSEMRESHIEHSDEAPAHKGPFKLLNEMKIILRELLKYAEKSLSDRQIFESFSFLFGSSEMCGPVHAAGTSSLFRPVRTAYFCSHSTD